MQVESTGPIKRIEELKPLSRDHHHGLLLCWKIRTGLAKEIDPQRIFRYAKSFFARHIGPHFDLEEQWVFPVLGVQHPMVETALSQHRSLLGLIGSEGDVTRDHLNRLAEDLDDHIRFEERVLFNEIQQVASKEQLRLIDLHHSVTEDGDTFEEDNFWE